LGLFVYKSKLNELVVQNIGNPIRNYNDQVTSYRDENGIISFSENLLGINSNCAGLKLNHCYLVDVSVTIKSNQ